MWSSIHVRQSNAKCCNIDSFIFVFSHSMQQESMQQLFRTELRCCKSRIRVYLERLAFMKNLRWERQTVVLSIVLKDPHRYCVSLMFLILPYFSYSASLLFVTENLFSTSTEAVIILILCYHWYEGYGIWHCAAACLHTWKKLRTSR